MKLTSTRVSFLAISAFAAFVAQQVVRSDSQAPSTTPQKSKFNYKRATQAKLASTDLSAMSVMTEPELIPPPSETKATVTKAAKTSSTAVHKTKQKQASAKVAQPRPVAPVIAIAPQASAGIASNDLPPVPRLANTVVKIGQVDVDRLPIDSIVNDSIKSTSPARRTPQVPAQQSERLNPSGTGNNAAAATQTGKSLPSDVQGHHAQGTIQILMQRGIVQGFADGTFRPDDPITDDEFNSFLQKASERVPAAQVSEMKRPTDVVTRADAARFVYRQMLKSEGLITESKPESKPESARSDAQGNASGSTSPQLATAATPSTATPPAAIPPTSEIPAKPGEATQLPQNSPNPSLAAVNTPNAAPNASTQPQQNSPNSSLAAVNTPNAVPSPANAPVADDDLDSYALGAGDKIKVDIFNVPEYSKEYQVLVNGSLSLFRVGNVPVTGLTLKQAERLIATRYARFVKRPIVDITLMSPRPLNVAIAGEVGKPGAYSLNFGEGGKFPTVTKLVQQAGGMTRAADPRKIVLKRAQQGGVQELKVDLWELLQTGNIRQDLTLRDGDMIYIPASANPSLAEASQLAAANFAIDANQPINIAVVGAVERPGPYALVREGSGKEGSSPKAGLPTLTQALQQAGGITQMANIRTVEVRRATRSGKPQVLKADLWKLMQEGDMNQDLVLQQGDTISVPIATALNPAEARQIGSASFSPGVMRVNVVGEVKSPGAVQIATNAPLNQALLAAGGFSQDARKKSVVLIRLNQNGTVGRREIPIDLAQGVDEQKNPILQNGDVVVVDKNGLSKFGTALDSILGPLGKLLPFRFF